MTIGFHVLGTILLQSFDSVLILLLIKQVLATTSVWYFLAPFDCHVVRFTPVGSDFLWSFRFILHPSVSLVDFLMFVVDALKLLGDVWIVCHSFQFNIVCKRCLVRINFASQWCGSYDFSFKLTDPGNPPLELVLSDGLYERHFDD